MLTPAEKKEANMLMPSSQAGDEDGQNITAEILGVMHQYPEGASQAELQKHLSSIPLEQLAVALNELLQAGRVEIHMRGNTYYYTAISEEKSRKFRGLTAEERLIYQLIEAEGDMGLWTRDMKFKSNLQQTHINKILRILEQRQLIKAVKSIAGRNRKVYMLYDLEPSVKVKGNAFYTSDGLFDAEFVNILNEQCERYIAQQGWTTLSELSTFIQNSGISTVALRPEDIQTIVNTLIYDGKVEEIRDTRKVTAPGAEPSFLYKPSKISLPRNGLTEVPCGHCPVQAVCSDEGEITPAKCPYLKRWLDQEVDF
ncbi:DNA-directed RNA polymerase III subunit RPC6 [Balamuthia mandrillaris]